jgi:hypothetical protein
MSVSGVYASNYWYKLDQAWNQSRASISRQFLNASTVVNSALTSALTNQISGTANLAAQAALKRIKGQTATVTGGAASTAAGSAATAASSSTAKSGASSSGSQYRPTSASAILSNSNVVDFFT